MKKIALIALLCILQAGISQNRTELELLLERQNQILIEAEFQLDSLEQTLKNLENQLETEKQESEITQKSSAEWFQKLKQLSLTINEQKDLIHQLKEELNITKSALENSYRTSIDSLHQILTKTADVKTQEEIEQQIYILSERRLILFPAFKSFSFDPKTVATVNLQNANDSLEKAIYKDYLDNARTEITLMLQEMKNMRREIEEIIYLRERGNRFLEDLEDNRPLLVSSQSLSERSAVFGTPPQGGILENLPSAESLLNMLEPFKLNNYPDQNYSWTSPLDSEKVILTLDEYKEMLDSAEDILQRYLRFIDSKIK
jgi:hypothetical protein